MPLYVADYLRDTRRLTTEEHGAYLLLIMEYWTAGKLPDDDRQLARIVGVTPRKWSLMRANLVSHFQDGWVHKRVEEELSKALKISEKRSFAARQKHAKALQMQVQVHTQSHTQKEEREEKEESKMPADAGSSPVGSLQSRYAFESGIIRLNATDFAKWQSSFSYLDLPAELVAITPWAESIGKGRWYHAVANALVNRNREAKVQADALKAQGGFKWNGIEGVT